MLFVKKIYLLPAAILLFLNSYSRNNFLPQNISQTVDTSGDQDNCYDNFFKQSEKINSQGKIKLVLKNGKTVSLASFIGGNDTNNVMGIQSQSGLADLDKDGKKELVVFNYTGGAHCCDEFYFFKNIAPGKYQYAAKTFAGDVCVTDKNEFVYSFYQDYGYFFTCFACAYQDSSDAAPQPVYKITLKYTKGKLIVTPGDKELRNTITDNLGKLSEQPYQELENEADQDNGLRKEFALNLAVYYYSFGKNLIETKKLFDKYYRFADSKKVWSDFVILLKGIKVSNDF